MKNIEINNSTSFHENVLTIKHFFEWQDSVAFLYAVSDSFYLRKQVNDEVIAYCQEKGKIIGTTELDPNAAQGFLKQLKLAKESYPGGIILNNIDSLVGATKGEFVYDFNQMREGIIELGIPMLFWVNKESHLIITRKAFDLYLRRDLSTIFFEDPAHVTHPGTLERFTESARESADFEEVGLRITLLEQQLKEARDDNFTTSRLANEVVLPLIKAYVETSMLIEAKKLLLEFENDFDYRKTEADTIIGKLFEKTGHFDLAIAHYEKALNKDIAIYGDESPEIANDYNNLGLAWQYHGNYEKAVVFFEKALNLDLKFSKEESAIIAIRYNNLGASLRERGDLDKALEFLVKALTIDLKLSGERSSNTAISYTNFGLTWHYKGNLDKAIEYYEKALNINIKLFGEESPIVARDYNNIGMAMRDKGNLDIAIEYLEKALKNDIKSLGKDSPNVAVRYSNLGLTFFDLGNLDKAILYFEKALTIDVNFSGNDSPNVAIRLNNLGMALIDKGNLDLGIEELKKALKIDLKLSGEENSNIAYDYNYLGIALFKKGDFKYALKYFEKSYNIISKLYGDDNPATKSIKQNYEDCLRKKDNFIDHTNNISPLLR